jgi:signal transduction histidine kinase
VQESITNVLRHSGAVPVTVEIDCRPREVRLRIVNPGGGERALSASQSRGDATGFGIAGMRERAELLGGTLHAGPATGGGFEVTAVLPYPGSVRPGGASAASQARPERGQQLRPLAEQS